MHADVLICNIKTLYTPKERHHRGHDMNDIMVLQDAFIAIKDGIILDVNQGEYKEHVGINTKLIDAEGKIALPGFVDSHTHLVHGGSRENELQMMLEGIPYLEILKQGGGILSTVRSTREASKEELYKKAYCSLNEMLKLGVTTVEAKSGYGLNYETERKQLEVANQLHENHVVDIHSTYLGAHAYPVEYKENHSEYIKQVKEDIEKLQIENLCEFVDVFCEDSVFNIEESREILNHAKELGLKVKIHADEIVSLGGAGLAHELEAISADHLMAISDKDIALLSTSVTVANLLPSTSFYLNKDYANARKMIDSNLIVSISSDYNPGSSPSENFQFVMQLAAKKLMMTPNEILTASTINAAKALGIEDKTGSLTVGKNADIVLLDIPNLSYLVYHFGINHVSDVFKNGKQVVKEKGII